MAKHKKYPRGPVVTVNVTKDIIETSERSSSKTCMIAEAIKIAVPWANVVSVDVQTCRFSDPKKRLRYVYLTPRIGQKALLDFDEGINPEPFTMTLKNAHVTTAKNLPMPGDKETKPVEKRVGLGRKSMRLNQNGTVTPVGGRAPAQMRTQRRFGLKAFVRGEGGQSSTASRPSTDR